jgi:hypothetical protein
MPKLNKPSKAASLLKAAAPGLIVVVVGILYFAVEQGYLETSLPIAPAAIIIAGLALIVQSLPSR